MIALFRRMLAAHRYHWARFRHCMNKLRLASVRNELVVIEEERKVLIGAKIKAMVALDASAARVQRLGRAHRKAQWTSSAKP
ncbi:hypothetical protein ACQ4WP_26795 [Janthinobacterium sp. GB4P2]|uniref:hypothetical protein n=1 Tax=Janthinobacterium sp. GB4P2 TaxID=3424189 RepID=UPI003F274906